jgi:hypothetical protein
MIVELREDIPGVVQAMKPKKWKARRLQRVTADRALCGVLGAAGAGQRA